uniref:G-patch domain-containing protein n=1 Tax=Timema genevievae TaxID=629358 RepID=A0A7R9JQ54_TIMGE|nr:unnamed protein product [Timema genevievae]
MADEEVMKFEITDYDLDNEFNINRPTRKISKNQQIYGIWADDSDGEEDVSGPSRPSFKGSSRGKANYAAPVSFVAGGVHQAGKKKESENKKEKKSDDEDDIEDENSNRGAPGTRRLAAMDISSEEEEEEEPRRSRSSKSRHQEVEVQGEIAGLRKKRQPINTALISQGVGGWERHTKGIGAKLLLQMGFQPGKGLGKALQGISAPVQAHLRKGRGAIGAYGPEKKTTIADTKDDSEEEEAREFVEKLSHWRKADSGQKKVKVKYVYKSIDEVLEQGKSRPIKRDHRPTHVLTMFLLVVSNLSKVKVIDMTGPQKRVLSGYHAIAGQQRPADEWEYRKDKTFHNFSLPELQHNLNLLMDMCEQDIIQNNQKLKYASDRLVSLEHEEQSLSTGVELEKTHIKTLEGVLDIVQNMIDKSDNKEDSLTLDQAAEAFKELQEKFYEEYRLYELGELAVSLVAPLVKEKLSTWRPLESPTEPLNLFTQWREILQADQGALSVTQDPYHKLLWESWMPSLRITVRYDSASTWMPSLRITVRYDICKYLDAEFMDHCQIQILVLYFICSTWNCRVCEPLVDLIQVWIPLLPGWILDNIREQLILPRITQEVEYWNPMTDTVPIHAWIHPWLPLLAGIAGQGTSTRSPLGNSGQSGSRSVLKGWQPQCVRLETSVFPMIRHKLSKALVSWHPSDRSARLMLLPWHRVFSRGEMEAFLVKNILPKLQLALQELVINPHEQHLEQWNWVMEWKDLLPLHSLSGVLEKHFFPKWLQVLTLWLNHSPNYDEITHWYMGWKNMVSESLRAQPGIKEQFNKALELMNRAVSSGGQSGNQQPGAVESVSYLTNIEQSQLPGQRVRDRESRYELLAEAVRTASQVPQGFKELIQKRCEEQGLLFVPLTNRYREGKQIYRCGNIQLYVDRNVAFVSDNSGASWNPKSLKAVLDMASLQGSSGKWSFVYNVVGVNGEEAGGCEGTIPSVRLTFATSDWRPECASSVSTLLREQCSVFEYGGGHATLGFRGFITGATPADVKTWEGLPDEISFGSIPSRLVYISRVHQYHPPRGPDIQLGCSPPAVSGVDECH